MSLRHYNSPMTELLIYSAIALFFLALPLYLYKHPTWVILGSCVVEFLCIALLYGSTFVLCPDKNNCGTAWAAWAIPIMVGAMNIGAIWPILWGYAKQAEKDAAEKEKACQ